jgi:hypothetical protein
VRVQTTLLLIGLLPAVPAVLADGAPSFSLSLQPDLLSTELVTSDAREIKEARVNSGLGLALDYGDIELAVDYRVETQFKAGDAPADEFLSQRARATLSSASLNELLGLTAGIKADSVVRAGGDIYRHRVAPGFSKSLPAVADLDFRYEYELDKSSATATEKEKWGYVVGLKGVMQAGRLNWSGTYKTIDVTDEHRLTLKSIELLKFKSRYLLMQDMHLEFSSSIKQESIPGAIASAAYREERFGAGIAWSPSEHYSLAFRVNKLEENRSDREQLFGSGTLSWYPDPDLEFSLGYGDQLIEGARGVMLNTRFRLDPSS